MRDTLIDSYKNFINEVGIYRIENVFRILNNIVDELSLYSEESTSINIQCTLNLKKIKDSLMGAEKNKIELYKKLDIM